MIGQEDVVFVKKLKAAIYWYQITAVIFGVSSNNDLIFVCCWFVDHSYAMHKIIVDPKIKIHTCLQCDFSTLNIGRFKEHIGIHNTERE